MMFGQVSQFVVQRLFVALQVFNFHFPSCKVRASFPVTRQKRFDPRCFLCRSLELYQFLLVTFTRQRERTDHCLQCLLLWGRELSAPFQFCLLRGEFRSFGLSASAELLRRIRNFVILGTLMSNGTFRLPCSIHQMRTITRKRPKPLECFAKWVFLSGLLLWLRGDTPRPCIRKLNRLFIFLHHCIHHPPLSTALCDLSQQFINFLVLLDRSESLIRRVPQL